MSEDRRTTRLIITQMVLENFKSYAGVQCIGPFHKRFTSIVGPNGSGKSNVIDAMLFVFGKRAKQLRLNKVSELIHKSANFPNLEFARVSVHFQEIYDDDRSDDAYEAVPNTEFAVTRIAYQNNQSKYTIDNRNATYTEVGQLLRSHGIDLDNNRFLILQGEVEQIAMMRPKAATPQEDGLLEYLEDIIGSNQFVEKIQEASTALEGINEQRLERINRVKIAEKERENLSGAKDEALTLLEKEIELRRQHNLLYQIYESVAENNRKDFQERLDKAQEKLQKEKDKMKDREVRLKELETNYDKSRHEYNAVDEQLQKASTEFSAFERRDVKLQEDMKFCQAQMKKCKQNLVKDQSKEKESVEAADKLLTQVQEAEANLADLEKKKAEEDVKMEEILLSLQEQTKPLRERLEVVQESLAANEKNVAVFQSEKEAHLTKVQLVESRVNKSKATVESLQAKIASSKESREKMQRDTTDKEREKAEIQKVIQMLEAEVQSLDQNENGLQNRIRTGITATEEAKAMMAMGKNNQANAVVTSILKAARNPQGALHSAGVLGRLGDLASIDPEFDVAVSTACGTLDYIVVETTEGAQKCITYLRDTNIGRGSFIVLDQMAEWRTRMERPFATPAGTNRLFDLVQPTDTRLRPALYMSLRDTIVADNLDQAVSVAYVGGKTVHRVVTKSGELIDVSGSMTGGGKSVRSGGMKLSSKSKAASNSAKNVTNEEEVTEEQVQALERDLRALQTELSNLRKRRDECQEQIHSHKDRLKSLHKEVEKIAMGLRSLTESDQECMAQLTALRNQCELTVDERQEIANLERLMSGLDQQMAVAAPQLQTLKNEVASLQRQILEVGGPRLARSQGRLDLLNTQVDKVRSALSSAKAEESNHRKQSIKSSQSKEKNEKEYAKHDERFQQLTVEQKEMESDALKVIEAVEAAKAKMQEKEATMKQLSKEFEAMKTEVSKIRAVEVDLLSEVEKVTREVQTHESQRQGWRDQLTTLRKRHNDEYQEWVRSFQTALAPSNTGDDSGITITNTNQDILNRSLESYLPIRFEPLQDLSVEVLEQGAEDIEGLKREINLLETEKDRIKSNVNMNSLLEYMKKDMNYRGRLVELEEITARRNEIRSVYEDLRRKRLEAFMAGFSVISLKLKEMYQMITLGGDAELELVDSLDPFSEGIVFSVRPPKKSWKNISNLSGGEKTLSSLALVFALHHYKPTPLYVMDEIDAALDFKNVSIVANYIKDRTKNAQFVIISLRNNMFELADRLVGIYKTHDATKSVTVNPKCFQSAGTKQDNGEHNDTVAVLPKKTILGDVTNKK